MERHRKIDTTLRERHSILNLLERIKKDGITVEEMEEIGQRLRKAGRRALSPLVRRLWREKSGEIISRYAFLLDFFEDDAWLDQLVKIALTRNDLEDEGRAAILAALEGYGVDVSVPPFTRLQGEAGGPLRIALPRLLDKGDKGTVMFMEDFVSYAPEIQLAIVREMPRIGDCRIVDLLAVLIGFDEPEIVREAIDALGRLRCGEAFSLLERYAATAPEAYRPLAERSLRRLAFLGVGPAGTETRPVSFPFRAAYASPVDGAGTMNLFIARWTEGGRIDTLFLEVHEATGMQDAWGSSAVTTEEYAAILREANVDEAMVQVPPDYVVELARDAADRSVANGLYLPPEFYVRRRIFAGIELTPAPYVTRFEGFDLERVDTPNRVAEGAELLEDSYFDGWFVFSRLVRDLSEEMKGAGDLPLAENGGAAVERFLERFCRERLAPEVDRIARRLFLTADLMRHTGRERFMVERTLAAARSLSRTSLPLHRHPFLRRWLLELMDMVRDARAEGFDFDSADYEDDYDD